MRINVFTNIWNYAEEVYEKPATPAIDLATALQGIRDMQLGKVSITAVANHVIKPIDGLDLAAQNHDKAYDAANASAENINWGTVEADNALVSASKKVSDLRKPGLLSDDGELDPYINLPLNDNQYKTSLNV